MAYDSSNEIRSNIATYDKNTRGDKIQIASIKFKDKPNEHALDIRNMYTKDDELAPTSKGVRISSSMFTDIVINAFGVLSADEQAKIIEHITSK